MDGHGCSILMAITYGILSLVRFGMVNLFDMILLLGFTDRKRSNVFAPKCTLREHCLDLPSHSPLFRPRYGSTCRGFDVQLDAAEYVQCSAYFRDSEPSLI